MGCLSKRQHTSFPSSFPLDQWKYLLCCCVSSSECRKQVKSAWCFSALVWSMPLKLDVARLAEFVIDLGESCSNVDEFEAKLQERSSWTNWFSKWWTAKATGERSSGFRPFLPKAVRVSWRSTSVLSGAISVWGSFKNWVGHKSRDKQMPRVRNWELGMLDSVRANRKVFRLQDIWGCVRVFHVKFQYMLCIIYNNMHSINVQNTAKLYL